MKRILYLSGIIVLFTSCQLNDSSTVTSLENHEIELKFGEQVFIQEKGLTVLFSDLIEESRCPESVMCAWAGNAEVAIQINSDDIRLNSYKDPNKVSISGYEIELISVTPYPKDTGGIQKEEYVVKLMVSKKSS
ncbi:MAG: hypothetical protein WD016_12500 [Balneolaceae bacterium]